MSSVSSRFVEGLARAGYAPGAPLGVAFSGGLDSTALLALAARALPRGHLVALHVDHGVREDSDADADHSAAVAEVLGVAFARTRLSAEAVAASVSERGPEGGLRSLRYDALARLCGERGMAHLAVAHQADDVLEGHLLALCRGSGLVGLGGPRWATRRGSLWVLRPLLALGREELRAYLEREHPGLGWVDDPSNLDRRYARNRLRHEVLPVLRELAGGEPALRRSVRNLREDRDALEALLGRALAERGVDPSDDCVDLRPLLEAEPPLPERVVIEAVRRFVAARSGGYPPTRALVGRVTAALAEPGRTRWLDLPGMRLRVAERRLAVAGAPPSPPAAITLRVGAVTTHEELAVTLQIDLASGADFVPDDGGTEVVFDAAELGELSGLILRGAREGDRFRPFGLGGSARLMRWLAERGIPRASRAWVPVLTQGERVLWVVGHRRGDAAPVTKSTERRLIVRLLPR